MLSPTTERIVSKAEVAHVEGATPRSLDIHGQSPWANLTVETTIEDNDASSAQEAHEAHAVAPRYPTQAPAPQTTSSPVGHEYDAAHSSAQPPMMRSGPSPQPGGNPAILPERYTKDLVQWQSPADLPERRLMVQRIIAMTRNKRIDTSLPGERPGETENGNVDRTPSLAKRIELSLYSRAASFHEYRDLNTLRRRLQSLVVLSFHEAAASRREANGQVPSTLGKRKLSTPYGVSRLTIKRPRVGVASLSQVKRVASSNSMSLEKESFFLMDEDVLRHVFAFVAGTDTVRCFTLNRFAARVLPRCVMSLEVSVAQAKCAFAKFSSSWLTQYPHIESFTITTANKSAAAPDDGASLHAWECNELDISNDNGGEEVVRQIAESIELGAGRKLRHLRLVSVFTNTCRVNALHALCAALVKGSCPLLEDLLLGGNGISDVGTVDIAWLLRVGSMPFLSRLDIRRNYIGESGLKRIMAALAMGRCPNLKYLCMGGNIITDNCVAPVVQLLSSALCPQMRFLGLEDNFLSARGVQCIIQAAVAGGMMPKLHHVSSDGRVDEAPNQPTMGL